MKTNSLKLLSQLFLFVFLASPLIAQAESMKIPVFGRVLNSAGEAIEGDGFFKIAICDNDNNTLYDTDGSTTSGCSEPSTSFLISDINNGYYSFILGDTNSLANIPTLSSDIALLDTDRFVHIWFTQSEQSSFEKIGVLEMVGTPNSVNARFLGGFSANDFMLSDATVNADNITGTLPSSQIQAFADDDRSLTLGDSVNASENVNISANTTSSNQKPTLRYNVTNSLWELSNNGLDYSAISTADANIAGEFVGTDSLTSAVDLGTTEVAGVLADANVTNALTISAGNIENTPIGFTTPSTGNFSTLTTTGELHFNELSGGNYVGFKSADNVTSDLIWTLPSLDGSSGQFLTTDGSGILSWSSSAVGNDSVTSSQILNDTISSDDIGSNAVGVDEISADAIGSSELASSGVTAGTYSFPTVTIDADGRITSAASNTVTEIGDISSIGDATTGDAFVSGTANGSKLVYEGSNASDGFANTLTFTGSPSANTTVTIPNATGTLLLDTNIGTTVQAYNANTSLLGSSIDANEIDADAIGPSQLAATTVTAGTYNYANITVDADGRVTSAASNTITETGDISAIGDATTGDAFTDDSINGTKLTYEGTTVDSFENNLSFAGDPTADTTVTIPNATGTLLLDTNIGISVQAYDANTSLLGTSIDSSEITDDTITASDIANDAISSSELSASGVSAGTYNYASITVDIDGRITSASSNTVTETGDISSIGDASTGEAFVDGVNNGSQLVYEGSVIDANQTTLAFNGEPSINSTITIPNVTGTLLLDSDIGTTIQAYNTNTSLLGSSIDSTEIDTNTITAANIAADAIGTSELASTSVTPGTYNYASITVDADGRLTSAASNTVTETGDISSIGDATTGDAFIDGSNNGTKFIYEGTTVDSFENTLSFAGDPTADTIVTIPNATGTLLLNTNIGTTVQAYNANTSLLGSSIDASEIDADAIGPSQLAATTVTAGTYNYANITVDADGRVTSASSNTITETGDISSIGDATTGDAFIDGTNNGSQLVYEGASIDAFETRLAFSGDPTADAIVTIPNSTGTLITTGDSQTVTAEMIADDSITTADIANNTITNADIEPDAIGEEQLSPSGVTAGSYTLPSFTVDVDGRITAASNGSITTSNITDNTITTTDLSASLNFADADLIDLSSVLHNDAAAQGLRLPNVGASPTDITGSAEGFIAWDETGDRLLINNGTTWTAVNNPFGDSIDSSDITDATISNSDIATDTITAANIAPDAIDSSELASTSVTPGTYAFSTITVDADGRITSASSNTATGTGDITTIGDATTGDAFVDGTNNGSQLVYEGTSIDNFETRLAFSGDPTADSIITIPNDVTGTLITTGDDGSINSAMISDSSITGVDIADDSIYSNNISPDAVGDYALDSTGVTPNSYTMANITVNSDGRITAASNGSFTETGDISAIGDVTSGAAFTQTSGNDGNTIYFEGTTSNSNEVALTTTEPASDVILTLPAVTGTLISNADTDTVSSTMVANNTITNTDINSSAAIDFSKLATLSSGNLLVGNSSNMATSTTLSGDATISNTGALTISDNSVDGTNIALGSDAQGDIMYYNGTDWARLAAGTSGQVLVTNGSSANPNWTSSASGSVPNIVLTRRYGYAYPLTTSATVFTAVGMSVPTVTTAGTAQPALTGANRMYLQYATTATANAINGFNGPYVETRPNYRPRYMAEIRTDSAITSRRIYVGLAEANISTLVTNTTGTTASGTDFVAIGYDTAGTGNTTDWLCCSGDGALYSCTTTGVPVVASTEYAMTVDYTTAGSLVCTVNGTSVTKITNLSTTVTGLGVYNGMTTLTAAIRNHYIAKESLEQN